ncbi:MAG: hypothetical protein AB1758_03115 [Candidatus Eremiobacterota bacterium]
MIPKVGRRGVGLGTALVVGALVATLGLVVTGTAVSHLGLMSRASNRAFASDLACSTLALGVERIFGDQDFGARVGVDQTLTVTLPEAPEGSVGLLSFDSAPAGTLGIPVSTNNIRGGGSVTAPDGQVVPLQSVRLVAVGRSRGTECQVEAVLHLPPFPYAAATDGAMVSQGRLDVGAVDADTAPGTPVDQLKPAKILSNAPGLSISLGPDSTINGDLLAGGSIQLDGGTRLLGQQYPNQTPRKLPRFRLQDYDPGAAAGSLPTTGGAITGAIRRTGDVTVTGSLNLQGALVYVEGSLEVTGSVSGSGILVTTGGLKVDGQTAMQASDKVALLSGGRIELLGQDRSTSRLRGVVYTEGGLTARQLRLEGALVANKGDQAEGVPVSLDDAMLLRDPGATRVEVSLSSPPPQVTVFFTPTAGWLTTPNLGMSLFPVSRGGPPWEYRGTMRGTPTGDIPLGPFATVRELAVAALQAGGGPASDPQEADYIVADIRKAIPAAPGEADGPPPMPGGGVFTVDPTELLPVADRARIILWRER